MILTQNYGVSFIPKVLFFENFDIIKKDEVQFKEDLEWETMSGGPNTFLSSWSVLHIRSPFPKFGEYKKSDKIKVIGCYKLDY